jgi:hypothetical protein
METDMQLQRVGFGGLSHGVALLSKTRPVDDANAASVGRCADRGTASRPMHEADRSECPDPGAGRCEGHVRPILCVVDHSEGRAQARHTKG